MESKKLPIGLRIAQMMSSVMRVHKKRAEEQAENKLTFSESTFLFFISKKNDEVIQKDMAEIMGKDKSAILRVIDSLEKKALVRRVVDLNDRRKNQIMITKKGERTVEQNIEISAKMYDEILEDINKEDLEAFYRVIDYIKQKADNMQSF